MNAKPDTRPAWLVARVCYQCDLIELCAREVEARGLLTSDVPERAVAALRRWADGSDAPGDRASWALKPVEHPNIAMYLLLCTVREAVRTRIEGERACRAGRVPRASDRNPIGTRGLDAASSAAGVLRELGMLDVQALRLVAPSEAVVRDDPEQQQAYDWTCQGAATVYLRETHQPFATPSEEAVRDACERYSVSASMTDVLVRTYDQLRGTRLAVADLNPSTAPSPPSPTTPA